VRTTVPRVVAVPFLLAVAGVLFIVGLAVQHGVGRAAVAVYVVVIVGALGSGAVAARRRVRLAALAAGRTCTCCTGTVHDPVKVI
jgi:hypothetical protein